MDELGNEGPVFGVGDDGGGRDIDVVSLVGDSDAQAISHLSVDQLLEIVNDFSMNDKTVHFDEDWGVDNAAIHPGYTTYTYSDINGDHELLVSNDTSILI